MTKLKYIGGTSYEKYNTKAKYKQTVIKYSLKYGVNKASRKFNKHRKTIYRWRERYDGTIKSLEDNDCIAYVQEVENLGIFLEIEWKINR